ncbi:hypothetical protein Bbelb_260090 [Branchiostoma belcheri]|nr:hypothetical protein Bbelb_260090 [Branchiostoma belcheri]
MNRETRVQFRVVLGACLNMHPDVVPLGKALYTTFLTPPRCEWVPDFVVDRNVELVQKLVQDCGADVNATNEAGTAPLHCIASDASVTERQVSRKSWAVRIEQDIVDLLLKAGADANVQDKDGTTPLHSAATVRDLDYARRLLQHGARVDIVDNKGLTALHISADKADTQLLQLLLQQGVSQALVNQKTNDDATPLHVVITAKAYYSKNHAAHDRKKIPAVRLLIDNGADLTSQNHGLTPLHLAAEAGYLDIVKMLVEAGANIHAEAPFTCLTPLDMAKHRKKQDVVDYLLAKAAETGNYEGGRPKRDSPSVEQEEDNVSSQQTDTPVEDSVEGAVGGIQQLDIKDENIQY